MPVVVIFDLRASHRARQKYLFGKRAIKCFTRAEYLRVVTARLSLHKLYHVCEYFV